MPADVLAPHHPPPTRPPGVAAPLVAVLLGVGAVVSVLVVSTAPMFDLDRFAVVKELVLVAAATITGGIVLGRGDRIDLGVAELALLAFLGLSTVSALLASNHWLAVRALAVSWSGGVIYFAARFAGIGPTRRLLGWLLLVAAVAGSGSGLLQAYGWAWEVLANTRAPGGTLGNRNFMAHLTVVGLPIAGWLATTATRRAGVVASVLAIGLMTAAVVLSRSRAAWLGVVAVVLVTGILALASRRPWKGRLLRAIAAAVAVGAIGAMTVPNQLDWRSNSPYRDSLRDVLNYREGSGKGRLLQYQNSLRLVASHPLLGVGPGNWFVAYPLVTTPGDPSFSASDPIPTNPWPSSDWVATITERGPLAALCWLGFLLGLLVVAVRRVRDGEHGPAAIAAAGVVTAVGVQGLFDAVVLLAPPTLISMAALGILLPAARAVRQVELGERRFRRLALFGALAAALVFRNVTQLQAITRAGAGGSAALLAAVRYDPGNYRLHLALAQRRPCPEARQNAEQAKLLLPHHPWPTRLVRRCR